MDPDRVAALDSLTAILSGLLPPAAPPLVTALDVLPRRIHRAGLGGFIGLNEDPVGSLTALRLVATALVTVRGPSLSELSTAATDVSRAFLAADFSALRRQGILQLRLDRLEDAPVTGAGVPLENRLHFDVHYEHIKRPTASEGLIQRIPVDVETGRTGAAPAIRLRQLLDTADSLDRFEAMDDPAAVTNGPGAWAADVAAACIRQTARVRGGTNSAAQPNKPGTQLLLRAAAGGGSLQDFLLRVTLRTEAGGAGTGGIGVVFRWQDLDNYYFFLMDRGGPYRMLGRKVAGAFQTLEEADGAVDATQGYELDHPYELKVVVTGADLEVSLDGQRVLHGRDTALAAPGRVGFLARDNNRATFQRITLETI